MSKVIILSRMYAGDYLKENIGHEVINLFKSDNGNNYIYVNKDGKIDSKYNRSKTTGNKTFGFYYEKTKIKKHKNKVCHFLCFKFYSPIIILVLFNMF